MSPILTVALVALVAQASPPPADFQPLVDQGLELYKQQKYAEAAEVFTAAYAQRPDPSLVFNIARCYERLPDAPRAIAEYRRYLELPGTTAEQRSKARRALEALEEETAPRASPAEPSAAAPATAPPPTAPIQTTVAPAPQRSYAPVWILLGVGAAGLGVGTAFAITASSEASSYRTEVRDAARVEIEDRARSQAIIADIGFGVGAASLIVAGALLLFGGDDGAPAVSVAPAISADGVGLTVGGRL